MRYHNYHIRLALIKLIIIMGHYRSEHVEDFILSGSTVIISVPSEEGLVPGTSSVSKNM